MSLSSSGAQSPEAGSCGLCWGCRLDIWGTQGRDNLGWGSSKEKVQNHMGALPGVAGTVTDIC